MVKSPVTRSRVTTTTAQKDVTPPPPPAGQIPDMRSLFLRPQFLEKSGWVEHVPFAFWLVEALRPKLVLQLGTRTGTSYFAFCQAAEHLQLQTQLVSASAWRDEQDDEYDGDKAYNRARAHNDTHYAVSSRLARTTVDVALEQFDDASIDLLHIGSTAGNLESIFEAWLPKLSPRAVVICDYDASSPASGPSRKALTRIRNLYPSLEFTLPQSFVILTVGEMQEEPVTRLIAPGADNASSHGLLSAFSRLGRACTDALRAEEQHQRSEAYRRAANQGKKQIEALEGELTKAREHLGQQVYESQQFQRLIDFGSSSERIKMLEAIREEQASEIASLRATLAFERAELAKIPAPVAPVSIPTETAEYLNAQIEELTGQLQDRFNEVATLTRLYSEAENSSAQLGREAEALNQKYDGLKNALDHANGENVRTRQAAAIFIGKVISVLTGHDAKKPPKPRALAALGRRLQQTGIFSINWYLTHNRDVADAGADPVEHYLLHGLSEGRDPNDIYFKD